MPFASVAGPAPAALGWAAATTASITTAGRAPARYNDTFGLINGVFLSAVLAHLIYWPKRWTYGVPRLMECEGLRGNVIGPYNAILYLSGIAATEGITRTAAPVCAVVPSCRCSSSRCCCEFKPGNSPGSNSRLNKDRAGGIDVWAAELDGRDARYVSSLVT
jgi:hypothetical protein